jgi:hypothetical protein
MDTKDKNIKPNIPGVMLPDSPMHPADPELSGIANVGEAVTDETLQEGQQLEKSPTPLQDSLRRLLRDKRAVASMGVIAFFVLL